MAAGSVTTTCRPSAKPEPVGLKVSWLAEVWLQIPGVGGSSLGRVTPRTAFTGCEKVSSIGVVGSIVVPGVGLTSASSRSPSGNQLTRTGAERRSQVRAAAATVRTPKRFGPVARSPVRSAARGLLKRMLCCWNPGSFSCDEARRLTEAELDRRTGGEVEQRRPNVGARRRHRRLDRLVAADEPRHPRGAAHGRGHVELLARCELPGGPDLVAPEGDRDHAPLGVAHRHAAGRSHPPAPSRSPRAPAGPSRSLRTATRPGPQQAPRRRAARLRRARSPGRAVSCGGVAETTGTAYTTLSA